MKKFVNGISIFLATVLSIGLFAACDSSGGKDEDEDKKKEESKIPTIEEIAKILDESENGRATINLRTEMTQEGQTMVIVADLVGEEDGNVAHTTTTMIMTVNGEEYMNQTEESYMVKDGSSRITYTKDEETGEWVSDTKSRDDDVTSLFLELLDPKYYNEYDEETGRYTMKDGEKITVKDDDSDELVFSDCYVEYKNGVYTVFGKYTTEAAPGVVYTMTLKYSDIGKVSVKLPAEIAG